MRLLSVFLLPLLTLAREWRCMNFYGFEVTQNKPVCSWVKEPAWYLAYLKDRLGINSIRLPFSYENTHYRDMNEFRDFIAKAEALDIDIILDYHRTWSSHQGATPEEGISMDQFVDSWLYVLNQTSSYSNVKGISVFNEIQHNDTLYTSNMHRRVVDAVETIYPGRFTFFLGCPGWGKHCAEMNQDLVPGRTFIEIHLYPFTSNGEQDWDTVMPRNITNWFVGEVGWRDKEQPWANRFMSYLQARNITNVCAWTIALSTDTGGFFDDDCITFKSDKASTLLKLWDGGFIDHGQGEHSSQTLQGNPCGSQGLHGGVKPLLRIRPNSD